MKTSSSVSSRAQANRSSIENCLTASRLIVSPEVRFPPHFRRHPELVSGPIWPKAGAAIGKPRARFASPVSGTNARWVLKQVQDDGVVVQDDVVAVQDEVVVEVSGRLPPAAAASGSAPCRGCPRPPARTRPSPPLPHAPRPAPESTPLRRPSSGRSV